MMNRTGDIIRAVTGLQEQGDFLAFVVRKKGVTRGKKDEKVVYGDDLVRVLIWTGFSYRDLVHKSKSLLENLRKKDLVLKIVRSTGASEDEAFAAIQETQQQFDRVLKDQTKKNDAEKGVWEPLMVGGSSVPGCRVYCGEPNPEDRRAPVPGHIYVQGIKVGEMVIEPAPNGHWDTKSSPKTLAKQLVQKQLPIGRFVQYALDPERVIGMKTGEDASAAVPIDPEAVRSLFRIAPLTPF